MWHILKNIEQYLSIYQNFKNRKIHLLEQAINCPEMPDVEKNRLIELKVNELYRQATGLNVDTRIRPFVLKIIDELALNEQKINNIRHYFVINQGQIQIEITKSEWCFLFVAKWIFLLLSIVLVLIFIFTIIFIKIIIRDADIFGSILQLFCISLIVGLMYAGEAKNIPFFVKFMKIIVVFLKQKPQI